MGYTSIQSRADQSKPSGFVLYECSLCTYSCIPEEGIRFYYTDHCEPPCDYISDFDEPLDLNLRAGAEIKTLGTTIFQIKKQPTELERWLSG